MCYKLYYSKRKEIVFDFEDGIDTCKKYKNEYNLSTVEIKKILMFIYSVLKI